MTEGLPQTYWFRALDSDGKIVSGLRDAVSSAEVITALRGKGQRPIEIRPAARSNRLMALLQTDLTPRGALRPADRVTFTRALATLVEAGVPIDAALKINADLAEGTAARSLSARLLERMQSGSGLAEAMAREPQSFPPVYVGIVRAAEASARMGPALARLANTEETAASRRSALRSAMIYPAFLTATAVICIGVLLVFVVPTFAPMLESAGREMPPLTRVVLGTADLVRMLAPLSLPLLLLALGLGQVALRQARIKVLWHRLLLRLPVIGPVRRKLASAALARVLGELLAGGVDLRQALKLAGDGVGDRALRADIEAATGRIEAGEAIAAAFGRAGVLAPLTRQMMDVGERSGRLAQMLIKSADILDREVQSRLDNIMALFTPVVTLIMGAVIAVIVSSILFALFSLNDLATG